MACPKEAHIWREAGVEPLGQKKGSGLEKVTALDN